MTHDKYDKLSEYLSKLKNPRYDIKPREVFRTLRHICISKSCQFALDTKARSVGSLLSYLSRNKAKSSLNKSNVDFIINLISELIDNIKIALKYPISKFCSQNSDLTLLLRNVEVAANMISLAKVDCGTWYCPLCWRQPAAGKHSKYCIQHMPASEYDADSKKFVYDTSEYRSARLVFIKAAEKLGINPQRKNHENSTRELAIYEQQTWGELKVSYPSKYRPSHEGLKAYKMILEHEKLYRSLLSQNKLQTTASFWGVEDNWRYLAKQIVIYIQASPKIKDKILISIPYKNETLQQWLDRLSSFISTNQEFDQENEPGEIIGLLVRYQHYHFMLSLVGEIKNTKPDKYKIQKCILMRNEGMTFNEIGLALNISKQGAHKIHKKYNNNKN